MTAVYVTSAPLNPAEQTLLAQSESVLGSGVATFVALGNALRSIRDGQLHRVTHPSFEGYCGARWSIRALAANRLIAAAAVVEGLAEIGAPLPTSEAHVRPLTQLSDRDQQRRAWQAALAQAPNGRPTGRHVQTAVAEISAAQQAIAPPPAVALKGRRAPTPERLTATTIKVGSHTILVHGPEAPALAALITELLAEVERPPANSNGNGNGHHYAVNGHEER